MRGGHPLLALAIALVLLGAATVGGMVGLTLASASRSLRPRWQWWLAVGSTFMLTALLMAFAIQPEAFRAMLRPLGAALPLALLLHGLVAGGLAVWDRQWAR